MKSIKIITIAIMLGLFSLASAQEFFDEPPPMGPKREQIENRIKTVKIWKLTEELNLTSEQSQAFFPIYNEFDENRRNMEGERMKLMKELKSITEQEKTDDKEITKLLDKLDEFDSRIKDKRARFRKELEGVLSVKQIGILYVFEMQFMHQMREIIRDARREKHNGGFHRRNSND